MRLAILLLALVVPMLHAQQQQQQLEEDKGPLISIASPDSGVTYAFATTKSHVLIWDKKNSMLLAQVTFEDTHEDGQLQSSDDTLRFRLPGVTFDEARKLFIATSSKGEQVPVARLAKRLFFNEIQVLPNAIVRVERDHTNVSVTLEAIRPADLAHQAPPPANADGTHSVDIRQVLQ